MEEADPRGEEGTWCLCSQSGSKIDRKQACTIDTYISRPIPNDPFHSEVFDLHKVPQPSKVVPTSWDQVQMHEPMVDISQQSKPQPPLSSFLLFIL